MGRIGHEHLFPIDGRDTMAVHLEERNGPMNYPCEQCGLFEATHYSESNEMAYCTECWLIATSSEDE